MHFCVGNGTCHNSGTERPTVFALTYNFNAVSGNLFRFAVGGAVPEPLGGKTNTHTHTQNDKLSEIYYRL